MKQFVINVPDNLTYLTLHILINNGEMTVTKDNPDNPDAYVDAVLRVHELTLSQLKIRYRGGQVIRARQQLSKLLKDNTKLSLTKIGKICGTPDHATTLHAIRTAENRLETRDEPFLSEWNDIKEILNTI